MGNESYVSSIFRFGVQEGTPVGERFEVLKTKFNDLKLPEAVGGKNNDKIGEKTAEFFETFSRGYESVEDMEEIARDNNKLETQKQFAMNDLDLLGKVVYDSIRDNEKFTRLIGQGSASEIDENLPNEFKGIGKIVLTNVFEEGPVLETLRELDKSRMGLIKMPEGREKKKLNNQMVREAMEKLAHMKNLTPGQNYDKEISLPYLELKLKDGKTGKAKSEKIQEIRTQKTEKNENKIEDGEDSEGKTEIPKDPEMQLAMVRETLNALELSGNQTREYAISQTVAYMEKIANILDPEVALEVRSRLKLIDCYVFMKMADGRIEAPRVGGEEVPTIGIAAARARGQNHALDRDSIKFFLETKDGKNANGLPIAKAWDLLQEANFNYGKFLKEVVKGMPTMSEDETKHFLSIEGGTILDDDASLGKVDTNYFTDPEVNRRAEVKKYMIKVLGGSSEAKKAVELADKLALATAETSIFNKALTGNDQLAEDIYFLKYRTSRKSQGRNRGATIHQEEIDGLGTSWLRRESKIPINQMMKSDQVHFDNIAEGSYNYFFPVWVSAKIHPLRNEFTNEAPNPKDILAPGYFKSVVDFFNKADPPELMVIRPDGSGVFKEKEITADEKTGQKSTKEYVEYNDKKYYVKPKLDKDGKPEKDEGGKSLEYVDFGSGPVILETSKCGRKDLRTWWALGVVQQALAFPELGWDPVQSLLLLEREMVKEKLSEEAGGFLSPEQWKWVVEQKVYWNGKKWLNAKEGALRRARNTRSVEFFNSILSGGLGGGKRKR